LSAHFVGFLVPGGVGVDFEKPTASDLGQGLSPWGVGNRCRETQRFINYPVSAQVGRPVAESDSMETITTNRLSLRGYATGSLLVLFLEPMGDGWA
jgi:hypothetical protein